MSTGSADATYTATVSSGVVTNLTQVSAGTAYTAGSGKATTGGTGTGLVVSITLIANGDTLTQTFPASGPTGTYYSISYDSWITGTTYQVSFSIRNYSGSGWVRVDIGTISTAAQLPYDFKANGDYVITLTSSAPILTFTPTADFAGAITNVSVKPITPSPATLHISDTAGESRFEIRSGGQAYNTFIGLDAGRNTNNSTQRYSVAVGYDALFSNIASWNNVAVGAASLYANTTGRNNVAVGESTMQHNVTGSFNTAVGFVALGGNTTGTYNTAVGIYALNRNTTAVGNVAVSASALAFSIMETQTPHLVRPPCI